MRNSSQNEINYSSHLHADSFLKSKLGKRSSIPVLSGTSTRMFDSRIFNNVFEKDMNNSNNFVSFRTELLTFYS